MTALWASVAAPSGARAAADVGSGGGCEAWWTDDERYVLCVAGAAGERWYVGELEADAGEGPVAPVADAREATPGTTSVATPASARPAAAAAVRTMLVGRQRGRRHAPPAMRLLHVRRPPRSS